MPRQISSRATWFYKISGVIWIAGFVSATVIIFLAKMHPDPPGFFFWLFPVATVVGSLVWAPIFRLRKVVLDGAFLIISNGREDLRLPLADVARISYGLVSPHTDDAGLRSGSWIRQRGDIPAKAKNVFAVARTSAGLRTPRTKGTGRSNLN